DFFLSHLLHYLWNNFIWSCDNSKVNLLWNFEYALVCFKAKYVFIRRSHGIYFSFVPTFYIRENGLSDTRFFGCSYDSYGFWRKKDTISCKFCSHIKNNILEHSYKCIWYVK